MPPIQKLIPFIFLIIVIWQIVSALIQTAAKKQQIEKQREEAQRRAALTPTTPGAPVQKTVQRIDMRTLAERRKAQLAELRTRRQSKGSRPSAPGRGVPAVRLGTPTTPTAPIAPKAPRNPIQTLGSGMDALRRSRESAQTERVADLRRRGEAEVRQHRHEALEERRVLEEREKARRRTAKAVLEVEREAQADDPTNPYRQRQRTIDRGGLIDLLASPAGLRSAIVLREVLGPPIALRNDESSGMLPS